MEPVLELSNVNYAYHTMDGETKALNDISFSVAPGEFVAFVGPSGCGKSTLLSILSGLLKTETGQIRVNGKDLKDSTTNIGYMLQHDHLFEWRTIYHNVLLGLEIQHMLTARTRAKAEELLELYGLKPFADSRPSELSGGQRQRLAIARALLHDTPMYIFDEAASNIDVESEDQIMEVIRELAKTKTILFISHRLANVVASDQIYMLENGQITESGTHGELMKKAGSYANMYQKQQELCQVREGRA